MNLANSISLCRLALIPVVLGSIYFYTPGAEWVRRVAFWTFVTAAASDFLDGYIARRFDQRTKLGAVLDPLADKLLINLTFVFLAVSPNFETDVPMWLPVVVLGRDITITVGSFLLNKFRGPLKPRARILGKVATTAHSVGAAWILINWPYGFQILMIMIVISVTSLADYLLNGWERDLPEEAQVSGESE